ncbi:MAG: tetratricopeptide repeat protein [bacterium]
MSGSAQNYFQTGNILYEKGDYEAAIAHYDSALAICQSATLYYNRGNGYFKLGSTGMAIADYLRAWRLRPLDSDINHNLSFARQFRADKNLNPEGMLARILRKTFTIFNPFITRLVTGLVFVLFSIALALYLTTIRRPLLISALVIFLIFLYCLGSVIYWRGATSAQIVVVTVPEVILRSGPGEEYKEIAAVHDGLEAKMVEHRTGWVLIQIPNGLGGWAKKDAIESVFK